MAFDGSGSTISYGGTAVGNVTSISWSGMERAMIDVTNLDTVDAKAFLAASLYDAGSVTCEIDTIDDSVVSLLTTLVSDATAPAGQLVITITGVGAFTVDALVTSCDPLNVTSGEKVTASVTFKVSGAA